MYCLELLYLSQQCAATEAGAKNLISPLDGTVSSVTVSECFGLCDPPLDQLAGSLCIQEHKDTTMKKYLNVRESIWGKKEQLLAEKKKNCTTSKHMSTKQLFNNDIFYLNKIN